MATSFLGLPKISNARVRPVASRFSTTDTARPPGRAAPVVSAPNKPSKLAFPRTERIALFILIGGLGFWFAAIIFPLLANRRWEDFVEGKLEGTSFVTQMVGLAVGLGAIATHALMRRASPLLPGEGVRAAILTALSLLLVAHTTLSFDPLRSLQFTVMTLLCIGLLPVVWTLPDVWLRRLALVVCLVLAAFIASCPLLLGMPHNRWFGGIQPNHFAEVCLCLALWAFLLPLRMRVVLVGIAAAGMLVVNSRGAIGQLLVFLLLWAALQPRRLLSPTVMISLAVVILGGVVALSVNGSLPARALRAVLQDTEGRHIADLSGRTQYWIKGLSTFQAHMFTGVGFRVSRGALFGNPHSGIIQFLMDFGLFGVLLLVLFVVAALRLLLASFELRRRGSAQEVELAIWAGLVILVFMMRSMIEPSFLGFSSSMSLTFMIALGRPVRSPALVPAPARRKEDATLAARWSRSAPPVLALRM